MRAKETPVVKLLRLVAVPFTVFGPLLVLVILYGVLVTVFKYCEAPLTLGPGECRDMPGYAGPWWDKK